MIIGELSALAGSCCWSACSTFFTAAAQRLGIYALNLVRLTFALFFLALTLWVWKGILVPNDASARDWLWLALSSVVGLVIGDLFYFGALKSIGPRITMLLFTLSPPVAAVGEWLVYGRGLGSMALVGMIVALTGVIMVVLDPRKKNQTGPFSLSAKGVLLAACGSICQGAGLVLSKMGLENTDPLSGTFIRMLAATPLFALVYFAMGGKLKPVLTPSKGLLLALGGAFFGPFLGVTLSLVAVKYTHAGVAQTILSTTPITVLPFAVLVYKERLTFRAVFGAVIAVAGISLLFI
jgi:drug/metabolite transporter (DMT)-like permease